MPFIGVIYKENKSLYIRLLEVQTYGADTHMTAGKGLPTVSWHGEALIWPNRESMTESSLFLTESLQITH